MTSDEISRTMRATPSRFGDAHRLVALDVFPANGALGCVASVERAMRARIPAAAEVYWAAELACDDSHTSERCFVDWSPPRGLPERAVQVYCIGEMPIVEPDGSLTEVEGTGP